METFIPKTSKSTEWTKIDKNGLSRLAVYKKEIGANQFCLHLFLLYYFTLSRLGYSGRVRV